MIIASEWGLLQSFYESNAAGQAIVVALLIFSFLAWSVMIGKYMELSGLRLRNQRIERLLHTQSTVLGCKVNDKTSPYGKLLSAAIHAHSAISGHVEKNNLMGPIENAIRRVLAEQILKYESRMVLLGSIVTGAPFLGLLGTVWGVMDSFGAVGTQNSVTLQTLAPGVSGALLTTVAGLLVAIPSVFGYNYLLSHAKIMATELENFASLIADRIEIELR